MDRGTDTYSSHCTSNGHALGVAQRHPMLVECFLDYGISRQQLFPGIIDSAWVTCSAT